MKDEDTQKTTVDLPRGLYAEIRRRVSLRKTEQEFSIGKLVKDSLVTYLRSNLDWRTSKDRAVWEFQLTDDPEDTCQVEFTTEELKAHYLSVREALKKAGVPLEPLSWESKR